MPRTMIARYKGYCRICRKAINPGDTIVYRGKKNSVHKECETPAASEEQSSEMGSFTIDWSELKEIAVSAFNRKSLPKFANTGNVQYFKRTTQEDDTSFRGYSLAQAKDWAMNGYRSDSLKGIQDFAPPIRERRRFIYADEGDEIDLSAAWAGEDNFFGSWTPEENIPGIAIEFFVNLYAGVSAEVVNAYIHWIAQAVFAIEAAGIDPEISMGIHSQWDWPDSKFREVGGRTKIRVKRESETVDISYWSAMLSPASFRTFGFAAIILAADSIGCCCGSGIDGANQTDTWKVKYEQESATILVTSPWRASEFPEAEMTSQLRDAIEELKQGGG